MDKENILSNFEKINSLLYRIHKALMLRRGSHSLILTFPMNPHFRGTRRFQAAHLCLPQSCLQFCNEEISHGLPEKSKTEYKIEEYLKFFIIA